MTLNQPLPTKVMVMGGGRGKQILVLLMDAHLVPSAETNAPMGAQGLENTSVHLGTKSNASAPACVSMEICRSSLPHRDTNASTWACIDTNQHNNMEAGESALWGET